MLLCGHCLPRHPIRRVSCWLVQSSDGVLGNDRIGIKNGKITDFHAEQGGQQFAETTAAHERSKDIIASIAIGLNAAQKVVEENGASYRLIDGAGMVVIATSGNDLMGGKNTAPVALTSRSPTPP